MPPAAAKTATRHQQAPFAGAAPVALRYATLAGFGPGQASPQHAPLVGAAHVALVRSGHQPTQDWAALETPVLQDWQQNSGGASLLAPE